jgi:hypothetical protein
MKRSAIKFSVPLLLVTALFSSSVFAEDTPWPEITPDGLQRVNFSEFAVVYMTPDADIGAYDRIRLLDPLVRFKRNGKGKEGLMANYKTPDAYPEIAKAIRERLSMQFREVFTEKLESGGYDVVEENAVDVLLLRPAIINLKVIIPADSEVDDAKLMVRSAGGMTLFLEAFDSVSGELLAKGLDRRIDTDKDPVSADFMYFWKASVQENDDNRALVDKALANWADSLVQVLDISRSH